LAVTHPYVAAKSLDDFDHSELKTQVSRNRWYDWDPYPSYEVSQVFTSPYRAILEVIDQPYDMIYNDIDDYFEMDLPTVKVLQNF